MSGDQRLNDNDLMILSAKLVESERIIEGVIPALLEADQAITEARARGCQAMLVIGAELLKIRREERYLVTHKTFLAYCEQRWGWKRTYVFYLTRAAEIIGMFTTVNAFPTSERQIRPLAQLLPEQRQAAWNRAVARSSTGQPSSREVATVVYEMLRELEPPKPEPTEAERKIAAALHDRRADEMTNYYLFGPLIEAIHLIADFHLESVADSWDGIISIGGADLPQYIERALGFLARLEKERPKNMQPRARLMIAPQKEDPV